MELHFFLLFLALPVVELARSPIVIIPGLLGSRLEAKLNKTASDIEPPCNKTRDWYTQWCSMTLFLPHHDRCLVDNIKLYYDEDWYHNAEGVQIRVPGFGGTETIEYLDHELSISYFHNFVEYFVKEEGYTRGKDINGAPYDWRLAPDGLAKIGYYSALHQLIEDSYNRNGQTPVTLVAHSLGGPVALYFLNKYASSDWKASRIKQFVSLSGAFGGTFKVLFELVSGDKENLIHAEPLVLREALRSFPSFVFLLPSPQLWGDEALVVQPKRSYTSFNYDDLFADLNYTNGSRMYDEVKNLLADFPPPNVTHYCFYGTDVKTVAKNFYNASFPNIQPFHLVYGNGDGTVNECSLRSCLLWKDKQVLPVVEKSFSGVSHRKMVFHEDVFTEIKKLLL